ncbi:MAG: glycosyltransferase family 39 protein [Candidatus Omnitrophica bacterium]|nr:glycosyltransferase family 39 protein [Candidatus Omnitrophota bacterium]
MFVLRIKFPQALSIVIGWAILSIVMTILGFLNMLEKRCLLLVLFPLIATSTFFLIKERRQVGLNSQLIMKQIGSIPGFIFLIYFVGLFYLAIFPVTEWDAVMYHLPLAKQFFCLERITVTPFLLMPFYPAMMDLFFVISLMFEEVAFAALTQFAMSIVLTILIFSFCKRYTTKYVALLAPTIFITSPIISHMSTVPYVEISVTLFSFAAFYLMFLWIDECKSVYVVTSGILYGVALSSKYYSIPFFLFTMLFLLVFFWKRINKFHLMAMLVLALLVSSPWYIANKYHTGSWIFPLFLPHENNAGMWDSVDLNMVLSHTKTYGCGRGIKEFLMLPANLLLHNDKFGERPLGIFMLFSFFSIFFIKKSSKLIRVITVVLFLYLIFWFKYLQVLRYLFPVMPFMAILSALVLKNTLSYLNKHLVYLVILLALFFGFRNVADSIKDKGPLPLTREEKTEFLSRRISTYKAIDYLNKISNSSTLVYSLYDEGSVFYHNSRVIGQWCGIGAYRKVDVYLNRPEMLKKALKEYDADYLLVRIDRKNVERETVSMLERGPFKIIYKDESAFVLQIL